MIRSDDGGVIIHGELNDVLMDFIAIIRSLREALTDEFDLETADRAITDLGIVAYIDDDDPKAQEKIDEIVKESPFKKSRKGKKHGNETERF